MAPRANKNQNQKIVTGFACISHYHSLSQKIKTNLKMFHVKQSNITWNFTEFAYNSLCKKGTPDGTPFFRAYFPLNTGARFSENAFTPSLKSSVPKSADIAIAS